MTQRKPLPDKLIKSSLWVEPIYQIESENASQWPKLHRTQTIKHDLDKHLVMLHIMPSTDKEELNKMVKK